MTKVIRTELEGVWILESRVFSDDRGLFQELWREAPYADLGIAGPFVQDNFSRSGRNVLRGLHYQEPNPQGKLIMALDGELFDVAVDLRQGSPSFGKWVGVELSSTNRRQLWIPPGFAHGFCVTGESALVFYKCTGYFDPSFDRGIRWDDPDLRIDWPLKNPILSPKDGSAPLLRDARPLPQWRPSR